MVRSVLKTISLMALLVIISQPASAQLGLSAGMNFEQFSDIETNSFNATFNNATGYHIGVFYDLGAGSFAVRPGVYFRNIQNIETTLLGATESFDLNMIEVPLDLRFRFASGSFLVPYVSAGPVVTFSSSSNTDFDTAINDLYVAANASAGFEFKIAGIKLFPEFRYGFGITSITPASEPFSIGNTNFTPVAGSTVNNYMLRLGLGL
ncbi:MAG: PorT family protein [Rhodothermales bacterium]|nr:PorT family protein [Rhodothermales bacterium]